MMKALINRLLGRRPKAQRYQYLFQTIKNNRCATIMEIGTWDGERALQMIRLAQKYNTIVKYYGFDLFEMMNQEIFAKEISKMPPTMSEVEKKLAITGAEVKLYQGFTQDTLPKATENLPTMDFIFIDGGHARATIQSDWDNVQKVIGDTTVVIFDDYWASGFNGNMEDGCRLVVESIDQSKYKVEVLPIMDQFKKDWGTLKIQFVRVQRLNSEH